MSLGVRSSFPAFIAQSIDGNQLCRYSCSTGEVREDYSIIQGSVMSWWSTFTGGFQNFLRGRSSNGATLAATFGASAVTGALTGIITHRVTKNLYRAIATDCNLQEVNAQFRGILEVIPGSNRVARLISEAVLSDNQLFFNEAGRPRNPSGGGGAARSDEAGRSRNSSGGGGAARFDEAPPLRNAIATPEFARMLRKFVRNSEGWVTEDILTAVHIFSNNILESSLDYLIARDYLAISPASHALRPADRVRINESRPSQISLGISTMILFLNIVIRMYERFFVLLDSQAEMTTISETSVSVSQFFAQMLRLFLEQSEPILQRGDSRILDGVRALFHISSRRVSALRQTREAIDQNQVDFSAAIVRHQEEQRIPSLMQGLVVSAVNFREYFEASFYCLMSGDNSLLTEYLFKADNLCGSNQKSFFPPVNLAAGLRRDNADVSQEILKEAFQCLYSLSICQALNTSLLRFFQSRLSSLDTFGTTVHMLSVALLDHLHRAMSALVDDLFKTRYFEVWSNRLNSVTPALARTLPAGQHNMIENVHNLDGDSMPVTIKDPVLLNCFRKVNALTGAQAQGTLRRCIASLQQQRDFLARYRELLVSEERRRPLELIHLSSQDLAPLDVCAYLLSSSVHGSHIARFFTRTYSGNSEAGFLEGQPALHQRVSYGGRMKTQIMQLRDRINQAIQDQLLAARENGVVTDRTIKSVQTACFEARGLSDRYFSLSKDGKTGNPQLACFQETIRTQLDYDAALAGLKVWLSNLSNLSVGIEASIKGAKGKSKRRLRFLWTIKRSKTVSPLDMSVLVEDAEAARGLLSAPAIAVPSSSGGGGGGAGAPANPFGSDSDDGVEQGQLSLPDSVMSGVGDAPTNLFSGDSDDASSVTDTGSMNHPDPAISEQRVAPVAELVSQEPPLAQSQQRREQDDRRVLRVKTEGGTEGGSTICSPRKVFPEIRDFEGWGSRWSANGKLAIRKKQSLQTGFGLLASALDNVQHVDELDDCFFEASAGKGGGDRQLKDAYKPVGILAQLTDVAETQRAKKVVYLSSDQLKSSHTMIHFVHMLKRHEPEFALVVEDASKVLDNARTNFLDFDGAGVDQKATNARHWLTEYFRKFEEVSISFHELYKDSKDAAQLDDKCIRRFLQFWVIFRHTNSLFQQKDPRVSDPVSLSKEMKTFFAANRVVSRGHFTQNPEEIKRFRRGGRVTLTFR